MAVIGTFKQIGDGEFPGNIFTLTLRTTPRRNLTLADLIGEPWVLAQPGSLARSLHDEPFRESSLEAPSQRY